MHKESNDWHQIIIPDPDNLSGDSVYSFMKPLIRDLKITLIRVADIDGAVTGFQDCQDLACFGGEEFLERVRQATQYDWACFYLYQKDPSNIIASPPRYKELVRDAKATIRLADDTYFYVYTRDKTLAEDLCCRYANAECKSIKFDSIDFPS